MILNVNATKMKTVDIFEKGAKVKTKHKRNTLKNKNCTLGKSKTLTSQYLFFEIGRIVKKKLNIDK